jgi:O-antigen ligase
LPHPNILGGFTLLTLLGPIGLFFTNTKPNYAALILYGLGIILIALTFSRSAWLGLVALIVVPVTKAKYFDGKQLYLFLAASLLTMALALYPLRNLVFVRISNAPVETEEYSAYGRTWLSQQAWDMIRQHPIPGVGIGSFILQLAKTATDDSIVEPVHNMLLLAGSELGIIGLLLMLTLFISIALNIIKAGTPQGILASATIAGLGAISFFDHYLWTLAPGRIMLGLALGLWLGQNTNGA